MAVDKVAGPLFAQDKADGGTNPSSARLGYEVSFTTNTETAVDALSADDGTTAIPIAGSAHPSLSSLVLKEKTAQRVGKSSLFQVTCVYGTNDSSVIGDKGTAPLSRPTRWNANPRGSTQEIDKDSGGVLLQNASKELITTTIPYSDRTLTATRNVALPVSGLPPDYDSFFNKVNNAAYQGYDAKRLLLTGVSSRFTEELYDGETEQYYQDVFTFLLIIKRTNGANEVDTWEQRILNEGTVMLDDEVPANRIPIKDPGYNTVITRPINLTAAGKILATNADPLFLNNAGAAPTAAGKVDVFLTADFTTLGL